MKDESSLLWAGVALFAIFIFYRISQMKTAVQLQQLSNHEADVNNPWLTVPGAISAGLQGVGSLTNAFSNLFSSINTNDSEGY